MPVPLPFLGLTQSLEGGVAVEFGFHSSLVGRGQM